MAIVMDKKIIRINHMYSKNLNIYGDIGNIYALKMLAEKAHKTIDLVHTEIGSEFIEADLYFIGGGQDLDQLEVYKDLLKHKTKIESEVENDKVFLLVCGGYQLFGKFFIDAQGNTLEGLNILPIETKTPDSKTASRCIGNIVVELSPRFINKWNIDTTFSPYVVGFENHGGQTKILTTEADPIGKVVKGYGNNSFEKIEGCTYKNIIGTYLHGSFLPKNPHITRSLIEKIIGKIQIPDLQLEQKAHNYCIKEHLK